MGSIPADEVTLTLMREALSEARRAAEAGDVPVGALIVDAQGTVIARGHNDRESSHDPTGHAEVLAIRRATKLLGTRLLEHCTLIVTLEPCLMCAGVILAARLPRIVFGAWDEKAGAAGSVYDVLRDGRLPHPVPEVVSGVCEADSVALLEKFFGGLRSDR